MLDCEAIDLAMGEYKLCERTSQGTKVMTHCLYPSFEPVSVFIVERGGSIIVHDGGGAARAAWSHGIESGTLTKTLETSARSFGCEARSDQIRIEAASPDWLWSAVASVAARAAVGKVRISREESLITRTKAVLDRARWKPETKREYKHLGKSGKVYTFDLAVEHKGQVALLDAVVSHPTSIAAKYLAFSDTETHVGLHKYALYEGDLVQSDKALLSSVANLVSYHAIAGTDGRFLLSNA